MQNEIKTFEFDGTRCEIKSALIRGKTVQGLRVTVIEGGMELELETVDGANLYTDALRNLEGTRAMAGSTLLHTPVAIARRAATLWSADRVAYMFSLAAGRIARGAVFA